MGEKKQILIQKEDAVFWMDENGTWCNEHGRFEHPKVVKYFNASIKKDDQGYFVSQVTDEFEEKVYFRYKETAIFAVDIKVGDKALLLLNTGATAGLEDGELFSRNDNLFLRTPTHLIKFNSQILIKLSRFMKDVDGGMVLEIGGRTYPVEEKD